jgi:hypothetical protein
VTGPAAGQWSIMAAPTAIANQASLALLAGSGPGRAE